MRTILSLILAVPALAGALDVAKTIQAIGDRCRSREYSFEGELTLLGRRGSDPAKLISHAKVKLAAAPAGKSYLRIEPEGKDAYVLVSDGQKSWAWVPKVKQYTEEEAAVRDEDDGDEESGSDNERDLAETYVRLVMPALARLSTDVQGADIDGEAPVKLDGRKANWPVLRVLSRPARDNSQTQTKLAIDPETLAIGRMVYSTLLRGAESKTLIQMTLDFSAFQIGSVPESTFTFDPPKGVKLVDAVPIPGQTGSFLLNQLAPDFELKTLEGEKVRLAELRGHPVLLSFWASWCGPCRRELPALSALNHQFKEKGLIILGVNDEAKGIARKYAETAALNFPTLDDSGRKAHRLYRVHAIPSVFLIDKNGKVVRFLRGARDAASMRASLSILGL